MLNEVLVAIVSGGSAMIASIVVAVIQHRKSVALIEYRLQQLEKKVDIHNNVIERTYRLEKDMAVVNEHIDQAEERISTLERKN